MYAPINANSQQWQPVEGLSMSGCKLYLLWKKYYGGNKLLQQQRMPRKDLEILVTFFPGECHKESFSFCSWLLFFPSLLFPHFFTVRDNLGQQRWIPLISLYAYKPISTVLVQVRHRWQGISITLCKFYILVYWFMLLIRFVYLSPSLNKNHQITEMGWEKVKYQIWY